MAASSVTMASLTTMNSHKVPQSHNAGTPRVSTPPPLSPSIYWRRAPFVSGFPEGSLKSGGHSRIAFAQPSASRLIATMAVRASVGVEDLVSEPLTGIKFPKRTTPPGASQELVLAGAGVRDKRITIVTVKVYAVGLYVEPAIASSLEAWKGQGAAALEKDEAFSKALIDAPVEKSLRIVLARDIDGAQFWGALSEALEPRLKAAGGDSQGEKGLATFKQVFSNRPLKNRTVIFLTWTQPSTLYVSISAEGEFPSDPDCVIESGSLLSCLYDVYLGKDPVSPSAKTAIAKGTFSVV